MRYETTARLVILATLFIFASTIYGYETETHSSISYLAIRHNPTINQFLKDDLDWKGGIERFPAYRPQIDGECTKGCSLSQWLELGSIREDDFPRYAYHFYNPLKINKDNGLSVFPLSSPFMDSLTWMWNGGDEDATQYIIGQEDARLYQGGGFNVAPKETPKNLWSWKMARYYYFRSLVGFFSDGSKLPSGSYDQSEKVYSRTRASAEAKTFYALGHVIHLLQDLAQPQHTRNDAHIHFDIFGHDSADLGMTEGAPMEKYCGLNFNTPEKIAPLVKQELMPVFSPISPAPRQGVDGLPKELSLFWDTNTYDDQYKLKYDNKYSPLGLAEYSNAYFVTDDTLPFDDRLPHGARATIINKPDTNHRFSQPNFINTNIEADDRNQYLIRLEGQVGGLFEGNPKTCGKTVDYISNNEFIPSLFSYKTFISPGNPRSISYRIFLCEANYDAQARKLLPKAVSYSAGLLEYFFRGRLKVTYTPIENDETQVDPQFGEECLLTVENLTTTRESLKGIDYPRAATETVWAMTDEELKKAAGKLKEIGRELRKNRAFWVLLEDELEGDARGKMFDRRVAGSDFFQSERNPEGFDGELQYGETFTTKVRLKRGHKYTLVFRGTIGNETQNAVAAKSFVY